MIFVAVYHCCPDLSGSIVSARSSNFIQVKRLQRMSLGCGLKKAFISSVSISPLAIEKVGRFRQTSYSNMIADY